MRNYNESSRSRHLRHRLFSVCLLCVALIVMSSHHAAAREWRSGEPIPVGTDNGRGPLASPGISCAPLGAVSVFGGKREDLFVFSDRWYPGLFLYRNTGQTDQGVPVFSSNPLRIKTPFSQKRPVPGSVFRYKNGVIYGIWVQKKNLLITTYDEKKQSFVTAGQVSCAGLKYTPRAIACIPNGPDRIDVYLAIPDGQTFRPKGSHRAADYRPYRPDGIWNGTLPRHAIYRLTISCPNPQPEATAKLVLPFEIGGQLGITGITAVGDDLVFGTVQGGLYSLNSLLASEDAPVVKSPITSPDGVSLRSPGTWANVMAYPSITPNQTDLVVACEGGVYYYQPTDAAKDPDRLSYQLADYVHQSNAVLFGGTLVVPEVVDWDGDGIHDIIAGNSQGYLLFFKNVGTDDRPRLLPAERIIAGGEPVHVQGGYSSIQGPGEGRWGYTCPTVVDWDGDGTFDILTNDINGDHLFYKNIGTTTDPVLDRGKCLYLDDLEMHGTWRTRPAAGKLADRMAYITLDDDDHFHLYWQLDERNLIDGGKLLLEDGSIINANFLEAGGTGRIKFELVDLDEDGVTDLLIGTPRHGSIPDPTHGLPQSLGLPGSAVLFMRNTGTDEHPTFAHPKLMHFRGKPIYFGQHSCAPTAARFGSTRGLNMIVGDEHGRMTFFSHKDVTWKDPRVSD